MRKSLLRFNVSFYAIFVKSIDGKIDTKHFNTTNNIIDITTNLKCWCKENVKDEILSKLEEIQEQDLGWDYTN